MARSGPGAGVVGEFDDALRKLTRHDVRERDLFQDGAFVGSQCDPDALQRFSRPDVADVLRALATDPDQLAVDGPDDVGERDVLGRPGQPETALRAPLAAYQACPAQLGKDRFEELARDLLCPGQLLGRNVAPPGSGELDGGTERIVGTGGQPHMKHYAGCGGCAWPSQARTAANRPQIDRKTGDGRPPATRSPDH